MRRRWKVLTLVLSICFLFNLSITGAIASVNDVDGHWAQQVIEKWVNKSWIQGYPDGSFQPDKAISKAEFVALVNKAFNYSATVPSQKFTDVNSADWFELDVAAGANAGYISGYPDGSFKPNNMIERQEVTSIIAKLLDLDSGNESAIQGFLDFGSFPAWSKGYINALVVEDLMEGYPDGTFQPLRSMTRAEAVTVLERALAYRNAKNEVGKSNENTSGDSSNDSDDDNDNDNADTIESPERILEIDLDGVTQSVKFIEGVATLDIEYGKTLTGLTLNLPDDDLDTSNVQVYVYSENEPDGIWGTVEYSEEGNAWNLVMPSENPYIFNTLGSSILTATFTDTEGNDITLTVNVEIIPAVILRDPDSVTQDPGQTGGDSLTYAFDEANKTLTISSGEVPYVVNPAAPAAGNWVGVAIKAPAGFSGDIQGLTIDGKDYTAPILSAEEQTRGELWYYFLATPEAATHTLVINWADQYMPEQITINTSDLTLQAGPTIISNLVETTKALENEEFSVTTQANSYANETVRVKIILTSGSPENIMLKYLEVNDEKYYVLEFDGSGVTYYGQETGFPLADVTSNFKVMFYETGTYTYSLQLIDVESETILASTQGSILVQPGLV